MAAPSEHSPQYFTPPSFTSMRLLGVYCHWLQENWNEAALPKIPKPMCTPTNCQRKKYLVSEGSQEEGRMDFTQGWPRGICASPGVQHISSTYSRQMKSLGSTETWIQMCSARVCKNSCLKIMFGVCLSAMTGKEFSVKVAACVALLQSLLCSDP